jgi:hypothetical protein
METQMTGKIAFVHALSAVRDLAISYALMSNEDSVLLDMEFISDTFSPDEDDEVAMSLYNLIVPASDAGVEYLMLVP